VEVDVIRNHQLTFLANRFGIVNIGRNVSSFGFGICQLAGSVSYINTTFIVQAGSIQVRFAFPVVETGSQSKADRPSSFCKSLTILDSVIKIQTAVVRS